MYICVLSADEMRLGNKTLIWLRCSLEEGTLLYFEVLVEESLEPGESASTSPSQNRKRSSSSPLEKRKEPVTPMTPCPWILS